MIQSQVTAGWQVILYATSLSGVTSTNLKRSDCVFKARCHSLEA